MGNKKTKLILADKVSRDACLSAEDALIEKIKTSAEKLVSLANHNSLKVLINRVYYPEGKESSLDSAPEDCTYFTAVEISIYRDKFECLDDAISEQSGYMLVLLLLSDKKGSLYTLSANEDEVSEFCSDIERAGDFISDNGTDAFFDKLFTVPTVEPSPFMKFVLSTSKPRLALYTALIALALVAVFTVIGFLI